MFSSPIRYNQSIKDTLTMSSSSSSQMTSPQSVILPSSPSSSMYDSPTKGTYYNKKSITMTTPTTTTKIPAHCTIDINTSTTTTTSTTDEPHRQVSFRTAARRFSVNSTIVTPKNNTHYSTPYTPKSNQIGNKSTIDNHQIITQSEPSKIKTPSSYVSKSVFKQQIPMIQSLEDDDDINVTGNTPKNITYSKRYNDHQIPLSAPTTFKPKVNSIPLEQAQIHTKFQRRGSTGYYDPRMTPSFIPSTKNNNNSNTFVSPTKQQHDIVSYGRRNSITNTFTAVPPLSPIPTKSVALVSSPSKSTALTENHLYVNNKVFQKRYNNAAIMIQRIYRGHVQRYQYKRFVSIIKIQTMIRQYNIRRTIQKNKSVIVLQKIYRGWSIRIRSRIYQLEYQLRNIEQRHLYEMNDIQQWKENEYNTINNSIGIEHQRYIEQSDKNQALLHQAEKMILYLRKENKKIRDKNETLQNAINQLLEENEMLDQQAQEYKNFTIKIDSMMTMNHENTNLITLCYQYEQRKLQFDHAIECRDEHIMFENKVGRLYLNQIQQIVTLIEDQCKDPTLVLQIEELCLQCNNTPENRLEESETSTIAMDSDETI